LIDVPVVGKSKKTGYRRQSWLHIHCIHSSYHCVIVPAFTADSCLLFFPFRSIYSTCTTHYRGNSHGFTLPCHSPSSHVYCSIYLVKTKYGHYPAFTIPEKWKLTIINLNIQHWSPLHWAPIRLRARIRALHRRTRDMITAVHVITIEMTWFNLHP